MRVARYLIGVDEVGRGPIAGPLCVGACLVPVNAVESFIKRISGIKDSKQLSFRKRCDWLGVITQASSLGECAFRYTFVSESVIDLHGLAYALNRAIARTLRKFAVPPAECFVMLDGGIRAPAEFTHQQTIIKGDEREPIIASASIVAKVARDRLMVRMSARYPNFGFDKHKGYGTRVHYDAIRKYGLSPMHRRSFLSKFEARNTCPNKDVVGQASSATTSMPKSATSLFLI